MTPAEREERRAARRAERAAAQADAIYAAAQRAAAHIPPLDDEQRAALRVLLAPDSES